MREPTADPERMKLVFQRKLLGLPEPAAPLELAVDAVGPLDREAVTLFGRDSAAERARRSVRRRYFELVLADGSNVVVFQDMASKRWFEQRG